MTSTVPPLLRISAGPTRTPDPSARNTAVLVGFTAITNLADGALKVALPLIAASMTTSPALVSGVLLTLTLPWVFAALHVGVLVDRSDRRSLLWLANWVRIAVVGGFLATIAMGMFSLPLIYVGGILLGLAEVIALTSAAALVPSAVSPPLRERANARLTGAETVCNEFIGPFVGGLLVAIGAAFALGSTAAGYVLTAATLVLLAGRFRAVPKEGQPSRSVHGQIADGLRFLWRERLLRVMTLVVAALNTCWGAWLALMPLYATKVMGLPVSRYGLLVGALGLGGLTGTMIMSVSTRLFGRRRVMFANVALTVSLVAIPAVTANVWAVAVGAFLGGVGGGLWVVNSRTVSQTLVPGDMMGRYSSASRMFGWGAVPVGAGLSGVLAEWFGFPVSFAFFSLTAALVIIPFVLVFTPAVQAEVEAKVTAG